MKRKIGIALIALLLTGCRQREIFETVSDVWIQPAAVQIREMYAVLPPDAASPVLEGEGGTLYVCDDYEIHQQVLPAGDLSATVKAVSGYEAEDVTLVKTVQGEEKRYDFVWASVSDGGDRIGKGCILDDGSHHYVITILGNAESAEQNGAVWRETLASFTLG